MRVRVRVTVCVGDDIYGYCTLNPAVRVRFGVRVNEFVFGVRVKVRVRARVRVNVRVEDRGTVNTAVRVRVRVRV